MRCLAGEMKKLLAKADPPGPGRRLLSPPMAALLGCAALVYVLVLLTQFKMMALLGNDHAVASRPGGKNHREHISLAGVKRSQLLGAKPARRTSHEHGGRMKMPAVHAGKPRPAVHAESGAGRTELYKAMAASFAGKWNLTTPNAAELLERQFDKPYDYDPQKDFFHFHHLYKSGGTSISSLMDKTVGLPRTANGKFEGILPGSYQSGNFNHEEALEDINKRLAAGTKREELPYKASYAHTGLRPVYGPKRTKTGVFFKEHLPEHKRLRVITMLRDPTDFRASNHAMIMCGLNYEVSRFNGERREQGLEMACSPDEGLNISALVDRKVADLLEKCRKAESMEENIIKPQPKLNAQQKKQCKEEREGVDVFAHCRSAAMLLESHQYDKHYRSMFKGLMGRFHRGQEFTNGTAYGRMGYGFERAETSKGYSVEKVEEYTLQDLGGLDLTFSGAGDGVGPPEPDFIWFGITERMKESTTLFYYYFKAKPLPRTPIHRIQDCRPTSWWTERDREVVKEKEPADYAVWRAANAILDVRIERMKMEIQDLLNGGATKESLYYVDWDQLEQIGVTLEGKTLLSSQ